MHIKELFDLNGKVALVTGGTGLYGTPISEALAEAGAHVVIASRNGRNCEEYARQLIDRGMKASGESYDQADEKSILALRDRLTKKLGFVDILVNNSVARPMGSYNDPLETWRQSMEVNATGLFAMARAFLEPMLSRRAGSMINIGSIQGVVGPDFKNYDGTDMTTPPDYQYNKHGLLGLTKYLAAWAGPHNVRVNAISPGGLGTKDHKEPFISQYCRRVFLGRLGEYDDIKGAVVFLASAASRYITGQNIIVDGGYTC
jgi:NAD(P)-dependent dehydrogenase (short-subunit alcohol dehydrogenase family)